MRDREFEFRLRDLIIAHILYLERYTNGLTRATLLKLNTALVKRLQPAIAATLAKIDDRGINMSAGTRKVVDAEVKRLRLLVDATVKPITGDLLEEFKALAEDEAAFIPKALKNVKNSISQDANAALDRRYAEAKATAAQSKADHAEAVQAAKDGDRKPPKPPANTPTPKRGPSVNLEVQLPTKSIAPNMARAITETSPMSGRHLKTWADRFSTDTQDKIEEAIRDGLKNSKTSDQIVRDIVGTRKGKYLDGRVVGERRRSMEALVRTAVNHIHNVAAQMSYAENADVVDGWKYLATLDFRTTKFCASHDQKKYKVGQGPIPPNHVRCRSICQPTTITMRDLGIEVDEGTPLSRASMDGPVGGDVTYDRWLRGRSVAEQDGYLGLAKAKAFRSGKLSMDDLVANDGRTLTLDQLRKLHPDAF